VIVTGRILQEVNEVFTCTSLVEQTIKMGLETDTKRQNTTSIFCTEIKSLKLVRMGDSRDKLCNVASDGACVSKYVGHFKSSAHCTFSL
jgi:hypothetical protein